MKSKKIIATVALVACVGTMSPFEILVSPSVVLADINEDVKNAQNKYEEYQKMIDEVNEKVYSLNHSIEELVVSVQDTEDKIKSTESEITSSEISIENLKKNIEERERLKYIRIREMYKNSLLFDYINVILSVKNFSDLVSVVDGISTLVSIDRDVLYNLEGDKADLNELVLQLEAKRRDIDAYKTKLNSKMESLELKKKEQENIIASLESEKARFGSEVLDVIERQLVEYQLDVVDTSNITNEISSAISQLTSIRDNQLTSKVVIEEVNSAIEKGNSKIEQIRQQELSYGTTQVSRGQGYESSTGNTIVDYAYNFLGRTYVWGAVGPDVFDCSGLTSYVYRHAAGIEISRTTYTQINVGTPVGYNELLPGDLVFTYNNEHVGIYVGNGMYINATYPGSTVRVTPVTNFYAARRILN